MYKGFDLQLSRNDSMEFMGISSQDIKNYSDKIDSLCLKTKLLQKVNSNIELTDKNGIIDVTKLRNTWFPEYKDGVFISHSHKDEFLAKRVACWLKKEFDINAFIDSAVWGYANDLLKSIDDKYCVLTTDPKTYDYDKRNYSTSQVNLILSSSLHDMIDNCECIIFLNTGNSINVANTVKQKTNSPWIYDELQTTRIIRKKLPERLQKREIRKSSGVLDEVFPQFQHDVTEELGKLSKITNRSLFNWWESWDSKNHQCGYTPLDCLYSISSEN